MPLLAFSEAKAKLLASARVVTDIETIDLAEAFGRVTIIRSETETREEVRMGNELKFVKVTPRHGVPYYLIPQGSSGTFLRRNSLDTSLSVPMWVLFSW